MAEMFECGAALSSVIGLIYEKHLSLYVLCEALYMTALKRAANVLKLVRSFR